MASAPVLIVRLASLPFERLEEGHEPGFVDALERACAIATQVDDAARALEQALYVAAGPTAAAPEGMVLDAGGVAVATTHRTRLLQLRRDVHHRRRAGLVIASNERSGLEPELAGDLDSFVALLDRAVATRVTFETAHAREVARGAALLLDAQREPVLEEGLRLASRALAEKARRLPVVPIERWKHRERHTAFKLAAYRARAAAKTSPHGVFSATALGGFAERAACAGENAIAERDVLVALGEARKIAACLAVDPEFGSLIAPRVNPTLRERDGAWTFWRPASARQPTDEEVRSSARVHPVARALFERCAPDRPWSELMAQVAAATGVAVAELEPFARRLVESGLLIAEIEIPWSERRPLRWLAERAREAGVTASWVGEIEALERAVDRVASTAGADRDAVLDEIGARAAGLPHRRALEHDALIRVDAASGLRVQLPRRVLGDVQGFLEWYARLYAALYPRHRFVESYARRFLKAFPADTDVDLLDLYHGIFEPRDTPRPGTFPEPSGAGPEAERARASFAALRDLLADEARRAERQGRDEVALDTLDWGAIVGETPAPRWSCGALFQVAASDVTAIDAGRYRLAMNGIYAGGGLAALRLAHLHSRGGRAEDGPLAREARDSWGGLEKGGVITAEVSYMHGGRTANAGLRPSLFHHEIELPGDRATPGREIIPLADLMVRYESGTGRFRLRSRSRRLEVRPVVASGISPEGLVSFLIAIGQQDLQPLALFPGFEAAGVASWPRFCFGRVVVFRRRWTIPADSASLASHGASSPARMLEAAAWRRRLGLPRHVFVHTEGAPKPFHVDLESPWSIEGLSRRVGETRASPLHLVEMLPGPAELWVRDHRGRYASEFLVHLRSRAGSPAEGVEP